MFKKSLIAKIYTEQSGEPDIFTTEFMHSPPTTSSTSSSKQQSGSDRSVSNSPKTNSKSSSSTGKTTIYIKPQQAYNNGLVMTKTSPLVAAELSLDEQEEMLELAGNKPPSGSSNNRNIHPIEPGFYTSLIDCNASSGGHSTAAKHQIIRQVQESMDNLKNELLSKSRQSEDASFEAATTDVSRNNNEELERLKLNQELIQKERELIEQEKERLRIEAEQLRAERELILSSGNGFENEFMDETYVVMANEPSKLTQTPKMILKNPMSPPPLLKQQQQDSSRSIYTIPQSLNSGHMSQFMHGMDQNLRMSVPNLILEQPNIPHQQQQQQQQPSLSPYKKSYQPSSGNRIYQALSGHRQKHYQQPPQQTNSNKVTSKPPQLPHSQQRIISNSQGDLKNFYNASLNANKHSLARTPAAKKLNSTSALQQMQLQQQPLMHPALKQSSQSSQSTHKQQQQPPISLNQKCAQCAQALG